jgi:hypothetical protein
MCDCPLSCCGIIFHPIHEAEYFFDRNPDIYHVILNKKIKELHKMRNRCPIVFQNELYYRMINEDDMEPCCSMKYYEDVDDCQNDKEEEMRTQKKPKLRQKKKTLVQVKLER